MRTSMLRRTAICALVTVLLLQAAPAWAWSVDMPVAQEQTPVEMDVADFAALWAAMHEPPASVTPSIIGTPSAEPTVPTGLDGYAGSGMVALWWDDDPAAFGFKVYRKKSIESTFSLVGSVPEAYYEDGTVHNGYSYDYCVSAVSSIGVETARSTTITLEPMAAPVYRVAGDDRYETAVGISEFNFSSADTAVLVSGAGFPDALSASSLCGLYKAPLLLTASDSVSSAVMSELDRLGVTKVFIVGGAGVVGQSVVTQIEDAGIDVTRVGGSNRYHTAELVARHVVNNGGDDSTVFLCTSGNFADALSIAPFSYRFKTPVLLMGFERFPEETFRAMNDLSRKFVVVVGGENVIPDLVVPLLWYPNLPPADAMWVRLWGQDRYYTSVAVVQAFESLAYPMLGFATGMKFPDALGGGVACGAAGGGLLLSSPTGLNLGARALVERYKGHLGEAQLYGGTGALSSHVVDQLEAAVE